MPSKKSAKTRKKPTSQTQSRAVEAHLPFYPLLVFAFLVWVVYRRLFAYPVWFDETIGKAIFFGLPVWLYITTVKSKAIIDSIDSYKIKQGLLLGVTIGGMFGFTTSLLNIFNPSADPQTVLLFTSDAFWWEFMLSIFTGFWESLFFFGWIMTVILEKHKNWPLVNQAILTAGIFLLFHIPNTLLRFSGVDAIAMLFMLFLFAVGQSFVFSQWRNVYALTLIHAIWGMVLLFHF